MRARYHGLKAATDPQGRAITLRFEVENRSREEWRARSGVHIGWQVYDPDTSTFITEGNWSPLDVNLPAGARQSVETQVTLPEQDGPYRVYLSLIDERNGWFYAHGAPLILLEANVSKGRAQLVGARVTTLSELRRRNLAHSIPKVLKQPWQSIWMNRGLIGSMARRDVLARYRGSFGDVFWTILNPLLLMTTYFFVFGIVLKTRFGADASRSGFALYFLAGMLPWLAFSEPVGRSPHVVLEHRNFVKKLVFPLETLPIVQVLSGLITEFFAVLVYIVGLAILRGAVPLTVGWLPVILIPQLLFTLGLCWFLSALGAYMRDLGQIMGFLMTLWFFLTPICYPETQLPHAALPILGKNPLFILVRGYRSIFLEGQMPEWHALWKLWLLGIIVFLFGYAWFHKLRRSFADVI
jgi:lipopolysaccharide transport system permease protein